MIRKLYFLLFITSVTLTSCKKAEFADKNYIMASRNGKSWLAEPHTFFEASMNRLTIGAKVGTDLHSEDMRLMFDPRSSDPQELKKWDAAGFITSGGDIIEHEYILDENKRSVVRVTKFDTQARRVKGVFSIHLKSRNKNSKYPSQVSYVNGKFETSY